MKRPRLLVTGFGPFPGMPRNPTTEIVEFLSRGGLEGVHTQLLPTHWDVCGEVASLAARYDRVVMFGVAGNARRIRYERLSLPVASTRPDAAGAAAAGAPGQSRWSRLPVSRLAAAATASGFPVSVSSSAGSYICNASYGAALSANPHSLFIHVPLPAGRGPLSLAGLKSHAAWAVALIRELST